MAGPVSIDELNAGGPRTVSIDDLNGTASVAGDVAMSAGRGTANTVTSLAGMPADILNFLSRNIPQGAVPFFPTMGRPNIAPPQTLSSQITGERQPVPPQQVPGGNDDLRALARNIPGASSVLDYQSQTTPGRYTQTGVEWALPALAGPGGLLRRLATGAAGGVASQGATDLVNTVTPQSARPYVDPIVGGIAGLLTMGRLNSGLANRANPSQVVREATRDISPADWRRAEERMAAAPPGTLLPAEALGPAGGPLQGITSDVAASRAGGPIGVVMSGRVQPMQAAAENAIRTVGGAPTEVADTVRNVSEGARGTVQAARNTRSLAADVGYSAAANEPVRPGQFNVTFNNAGATIPPRGPLADELRGLMDEVNSAQNMAQVDSAYRRIRNMASEAFAADASSERGHMLSQLAQGINNQLISGSPGIAAGRNAYRALSPAVNELRNPELLGRLQKALLEENSVPAALQRQLDVIHGATQSPQQIGRVFNEMAMSSQPQAARDLGAILLRRELDQASRRVATNTDATGTGARFATALMETPETAARTEAVIRGMAQANGQNPDRAWTGFSRLLDAFAQTGRIPAVGSRTEPRAALARAMGSNWGSAALDALNVTRGSVLRNASTALAERAASADYADLARALSRPDGLQILRDMAGQFPNSPRARMMATRFLELGQQGQRVGDQR